MTEIVSAFTTIFQQVSLVESAVFFIYCLIGAAAFFIIKVWFPHYLSTKKLELDRENRKAELLEATLKNMIILLQSNTDAIQGFNKSISYLDITLSKVSDKIHEHDARGSSMGENIKTVNSELIRLKETTPTVTDLNRLHQRIDALKTETADKQDMDLVIRKLDEILRILSEMKGKVF